jgi:phosphoesterase RecJ-like protein
LRSIGDFDVSKIALEFGGGGHKNAAGFSGKSLLI